MAKSDGSASVEWAGGIGAMHALVTGEGEPYRPEILFWVGQEGAILGQIVGRPGEVVGAAVASLRETMRRPAWGAPHVPARVRVSSPQLAAVLREGHPGVEVICAPTPEIDEVLAKLHENWAARAREEWSYLSSGLEPAAVAALFRATARLYRAKPWKIVPDDEALIAVTIEKLGVRDAAVSVIGQLGESLGFVVFPAIEHFEAYLDSADALERGEEGKLPAHFALSFERGAELPAALRKEVTRHGWEVAAANAYPWMLASDGEAMGLAPTAEQTTVAEAIALALPRFLSAGQPLLAAWDGGEPVAQTLRVEAHSGPMQVALRVPYRRTGRER